MSLVIGLPTTESLAETVVGNPANSTALRTESGPPATPDSNLALSESGQVAASPTSNHARSARVGIDGSRDVPGALLQPEPHLIFLVDEDPVAGEHLASVLASQPDYTVRSFRCASTARLQMHAESAKPTLVICEQAISEGDGISFLAKLREEFPDTVRILLTTHADKESVVRAVNDGGVFQYIEKPWDPEQVLLVVRNAIDRGDLVATLRRTVAAMQNNNQALSVALLQIHAAQERLVESERMAAVGRVASGIAHEIGNQLSVLSYAELIRDRYPDDTEIRLFTAAILSARARLGGLVGEIRDFSRVHGVLPRAQTNQPAPQTIQLSEEAVSLSVQEALSILRFDPAFRQRTIERSLDCPAIARINHDKMVQVFVNLLRNALDATHPGGDIHIQITTAAPQNTVESPPKIRVFVDDYGEGIPSDVLPRIFEPFFTTKGDRGTGLGLGICRSIVAQHNGQMIVESPIPGRVASAGHQGTRVTVTLPMVEKPHEAPLEIPNQLPHTPAHEIAYDM